MFDTFSGDVKPQCVHYEMEGYSVSLNAVEKVTSSTGVNIYNLGTGIGYSVLDIVRAFEAANGVKIPYVIKDRRPGDIAICYADPKKAKEELGWEAKYDLQRMCEDSWRFAQMCQE